MNFLTTVGFYAQNRFRKASIVVCVVLLALAGFQFSSQGARAQNVEALAGRIADSLNALKSEQFKTVALSRIKPGGGDYPVNDLIDFINVKMVRGRRFKVVDRNRLNAIISEQQVQLSDFVSSEKYQELGKVLGIDLFIYGTFYDDSLIMKAIDVQTSALAWADVFVLSQAPEQATFLWNMGLGMAKSLGKDLARLEDAKIRQVSFWNFDTGGIVPEAAVMDYLSVVLTKQGRLKVVDRENIRLIAKEQQLNQEVFIDENSAKRLGELHGVDAFIYGGISRRDDGNFLASLKMMNVFNGVIEWADLVRIAPESQQATARNSTANNGKAAPRGMVLISAGEFLMGSNGNPPASRPLHKVNLQAYFIDITEVSNQDYGRFIKDRKHRAPVGWINKRYPSGSANLPVVGVSWDDADGYCRWAGKRLPTESQWEKAARGTNGQPYPWSGKSFSPGYAVTRESGQKKSTAVHRAKKDVSPFGVKHLAGNVREWVSNKFRPYRGNNSSRDPRYNKEQVLRGGSWATDSRSTFTYFRGSSMRNLAWPDVGFRCAKAAG